MTDVTSKEIVKEFSKKMLDLDPAHEDERHCKSIFNIGFRDEMDLKDLDWEDLYYRMGNAKVYASNGTFIAKVGVTDSEGERYEFKTNSLSGHYLNGWILYNHFKTKSTSSYRYYIFESQVLYIDRECATSSLEQLKKELTDEVLRTIFKGHYVVSFKYLLANPRRDVVEWALKHKEELGLALVKPEFVEKYQAVPELKELILNALEKKGE